MRGDLSQSRRCNHAFRARRMGRTVTSFWTNTAKFHTWLRWSGKRGQLILLPSSSSEWLEGEDPELIRPYNNHMRGLAAAGIVVKRQTGILAKSARAEGRLNMAVGDMLSASRLGSVMTEEFYRYFRGNNDRLKHLPTK